MGLYLDDGTVLTRDPVTGGIVRITEEHMPDHLHKMQGMLSEEQRRIKKEERSCDKAKTSKKK